TLELIKISSKSATPVCRSCTLVLRRTVTHHTRRREGVLGPPAESIVSVAPPRNPPMAGTPHSSRNTVTCVIRWLHGQTLGPTPCHGQRRRSAETSRGPADR